MVVSKGLELTLRLEVLPAISWRLTGPIFMGPPLRILRGLRYLHICVWCNSSAVKRDNKGQGFDAYFITLEKQQPKYSQF